MSSEKSVSQKCDVKNYAPTLQNDCFIWAQFSKHPLIEVVESTKDRRAEV